MISGDIDILVGTSLIDAYDIKVQDNGVKIYFRPLNFIPQQRLNDLAFELGIRGTTAFNELNRTHWLIKRINLIEVLKDAGISVLAPT